MSPTVNIVDLPTSEELLAEDEHTSPNAQISQEPLQGAAFRLINAQ
ncbi:hypothetical protein ACFZB9_22655 [Kitasatospora sp. NPDC008050]